MKEKYYCENCNDDVDYAIVEEAVSRIIRTDKHECITKECLQKYAKCCWCGDYLFIAELRDENLRTLYEV